MIRADLWRADALEYCLICVLQYDCEADRMLGIYLKVREKKILIDPLCRKPSDEKNMYQTNAFNKQEMS